MSLSCSIRSARRRGRCPPRRAVLSLAAALVLGGCAATDADRQLAPARALAAREFDAGLRLLDTDAARREADSEVDRRLAAPLAVDDAVRIALAYSPALQALLTDRLGEAAGAAQSARLPNPVFRFEHLLQTAAGTRELEIDRSFGFSLVDLALLPGRLRLAERAQAAARLGSAADVARVATGTRIAWVDAVAAAQVAVYAAQVRGAAEAGAELAARMRAGGNYSRLQQAREQAFLADAITQQTRASLAAAQAREALVRRLGLDPQRAARLTLPDRLPDPPPTLPPEGTVVQTGLDERLDVQAARAELDRAAREQGLSTVTGVVNGFDLALEHNSLPGGPQRGYELTLPLPVFDAGGATRARAQAGYLAALNRTAQTGVDATSQLREAYAGLRTAHALARHYRDEVMPLRRAIADENLLRYNGMLIGVFDLLADRREQIASVSAAFEADRDYWRADAELKAARLGATAPAPAMAAR